MKIEDKGIIIYTEQFQEKMQLIKLFSSENGICKGVVRCASKKVFSNSNKGNIVHFQKFYRLNDQLGKISCELIESFQGDFFLKKEKLIAFEALSVLLLSCFEDMDQQNELYNCFYNYLNSLRNEFCWLKYVNMELKILEKAGYGLQLEKCAVTQSCEDLVYVSPKTGRAVSKGASNGYESLLLKLPQFLILKTEPEKKEEVFDALELTEYFLKRYVWKYNITSGITSSRNMLRSIWSL